jgi:hypothetical protein
MAPATRSHTGDQGFASELLGATVGFGTHYLLKSNSQKMRFPLHTIHNLLQFWDNIESIATRTTPVLVFGLLVPAGDKSFVWKPQ